MNLMTVNELIDLLEEEGVKNAGEKISDIMLGLDYCNRITKQEEQYKSMVTLAKLVRNYMNLPEANGRKWPGTLLQNMQDYVLGQMEGNQVPVPRLIHFVWIGSPIPPVVMNYIKVWAKINSDYTINIWYDSNLLGLKKLSDLLKREAKRRFPEKDDHDNWADAVFRLRQDFTRFVLENDPGFQNMSQTMQDFSAAIGTEEDFGAEHVWQGELPSLNIRLCDMQREGVFTEEIYPVYMREAIQTQNFAALSDMARLLVLKKCGGVYLDTDMLPEINSDLIQKFCDKEIHMQRPLLQAIMEAIGERGGIADYSTEKLESCDRKEEMRNEVAGKELKQLMVPLGEMRCNPMAFRVFYSFNIINQMVVSHPGSMMVNLLLTQIVQNYHTMDEYFGAPPFTGQSLAAVTRAREDAVARGAERRIQEMLRRSYGYYKTGLIKDYKCTISLTGPGIYTGAILDVSYLESGTCSRLGEGVLLDKYECYGIPFHKLSVYTEEELRSSWVAKE